MVNALSLLVLWGPCLASASTWQLDRGNAHELRVWIDDKIGKTEEMPCVSDIPGGRWMAGATMVGGMVVWEAVTVALVYYLVGKRSESLVLPGPTGPSAPANDSPNDAAGAPPMKPAKKKRVYMYSLDGMRTILVTCVIFAHYPIGLPSICKHFLGWPMQFFFCAEWLLCSVCHGRTKRTAVHLGQWFDLCRSPFGADIAIVPAWLVLSVRIGRVRQP